MTPSRDELCEAVRDAMQDQPNALARAQLLRDIIGAGYDAITFLSGNTEVDDDERWSAGQVRGEALAHQNRIAAWDLERYAGTERPGSPSADLIASSTVPGLPRAAATAARGALRIVRRPAPPRY